jgi:hypothetical protein
MADALKLYIVRNNAIPDTNQWHIAISGQLGLAPSQITTTPRNYSRAYLIDTGGWLETALASGPWTQPSTGTAFTGGARLMIVSTVGGPQLPVISPASFKTIWNTPLRASPWPTTTWAGRGEDLVIQRINLDPLFCRVILSPIDTTSPGSFAITNGIVSTTTTVASVPSDTWCLQGSVLSLYNTNNPPVGSPPDTKAIVQADCSYVFENMAWRAQVSGFGTNGPFPNPVAYAASVAANNFTSLASKFQSFGSIHQTGASTLRHDSTPEILGAFYTFMNDYDTWAQLPQTFDVGSFNNSSATFSALASDTNVIQGITSRMAQ